MCLARVRAGTEPLQHLVQLNSPCIRWPVYIGNKQYRIHSACPLALTRRSQKRKSYVKAVRHIEIYRIYYFINKREYNSLSFLPKTQWKVEHRQSNKIPPHRRELTQQFILSPQPTIAYPPSVRYQRRKSLNHPIIADATESSGDFRDSASLHRRTDFSSEQNCRPWAVQRNNDLLQESPRTLM
jgi:hypothetical protein